MPSYRKRDGWARDGRRLSSNGIRKSRWSRYDTPSQNLRSRYSYLRGKGCRGAPAPSCFGPASRSVSRSYDTRRGHCRPSSPPPRSPSHRKRRAPVESLTPSDVASLPPKHPPYSSRRLHNDRADDHPYFRCEDRKPLPPSYSPSRRYRPSSVSPPPRLKKAPSKKPDPVDNDGIVHFSWSPGMRLGERFVVQRQLGEGTFGRVVECLDLSTGELVATKIVRDVGRYTSAAQIEAEILEEICDRDAEGESNCVRLIDRFLYDRKLRRTCRSSSVKARRRRELRDRKYNEKPPSAARDRSSGEQRYRRRTRDCRSRSWGSKRSYLHDDDDHHHPASSRQQDSRRGRYPPRYDSRNEYYEQYRTQAASCRSPSSRENRAGRDSSLSRNRPRRDGRQYYRTRNSVSSWRGAQSRSYSEYRKRRRGGGGRWDDRSPPERGCYRDYEDKRHRDPSPCSSLPSSCRNSRLPRPPLPPCRNNVTRNNSRNRRSGDGQGSGDDEYGPGVHMCLVFEKLGPSLYSFLSQNQYRGFFMEDIQRITADVLKALAFLHRISLTHTDLKPENILFLSDKSRRDFLPRARYHPRYWDGDASSDESDEGGCDEGLREGRRMKQRDYQYSFPPPSSRSCEEGANERHFANCCFAKRQKDSSFWDDQNYCKNDATAEYRVMEQPSFRRRRYRGRLQGPPRSRDRHGYEYNNHWNASPHPASGSSNYPSYYREDSRGFSSRKYRRGGKDDCPSGPEARPDRGGAYIGSGARRPPEEAYTGGHPSYGRQHKEYRSRRSPYTPSEYRGHKAWDNDEHEYYNSDGPSHTKNEYRRPRNSLYYNRPIDCSVKLIDFGSATFEDDTHCSLINTRQYRAPEVILQTGWSMSSDMWCLGCILMELYNGVLLFRTHEHLEHLALIERIIGPFPQQMLQAAANTDAAKHLEKMTASRSDGNSIRYRIRWPQGASSDKSVRKVARCRRLEDLIHPRHKLFADFLRSLLVPDPHKRATPIEALRHPFLHVKIPEA